MKSTGWERLRPNTSYVEDVILDLLCLILTNLYGWVIESIRRESNEKRKKSFLNVRSNVTKPEVLFSIFLLYSKYSILPHLQFDNGGWGKVHVKIAFSAHLRSLQYDYSNVLQYDLYEYTTIVDPGTYRYLHRTKYWIWNVRPVVGCGHHIMVVVLPDRNSWTNNPFYCADLPSDSVGE